MSDYDAAGLLGTVKLAPLVKMPPRGKSFVEQVRRFIGSSLPPGAKVTNISIEESMRDTNVTVTYEQPAWPPQHAYCRSSTLELHMVPPAILCSSCGHPLVMAADGSGMGCAACQRVVR